MGTNLLLLSFISHFLFQSIPVTSQSENSYATSTTPPVLIPRLETWARAMQLSFRSISEPPMQSQFPSHSSRMALESHSPLLPTDSPFLDGNSDVLGMAMRSIAWLIKLNSIHAQRLVTVGAEAKILEVCKHNYDNAVSNLQQAMEALVSKNVERVNSMLKAVLSDIGHCRDEYSGKLSSLASYDDKVTKMTNNCLMVLDLVR